MSIKENDVILKLVNPTIEYKEQVMNYRKVFLESNESFDGCSGLEECETYEEWIDFENRLSRKYGNQYVPSTVYLAIRVSDNKLIGIIDFRHSLSEFLLNYGGNIGYSVLPEERRKGYAKEMLRMVLEHCREYGLHRVLVTCDKYNIGSYKTIQANGGILENEITDSVNLSKSGVIQRYWISLKKRYSDRFLGGRVKQSEQKVISVNEKNFTGDIYFYNFLEVKEKMIIPNGKCIIDNNYKWLEFYDYNSKVKLTAIYNEKNEIVEWYFDIAREIGKENNIAYEDDLYLDVVVTPNGEIILLDEDELKEALNRKEITNLEYENAYEETKKLVNRLQGKNNELLEFTNKYLNI